MDDFCDFYDDDKVCGVKAMIANPVSGFDCDSEYYHNYGVMPLESLGHSR
jgi:hypothetical protein